MKFLFFCLGVAAALAVGCGDDSPAGGSSAGGDSAGGANTGGAPGTGGTAEGGAAPQALCADTSAVGSCPTLTACDVNINDEVADVLCGCAAAQEGELCQAAYSGPGEGCSFGIVCTGGEWVEELPP